MKLVYLTDSFPYGRSEAFIIPEVRELIRRGHDVEIYPIKPRPATEIVHDEIDDLLARTHHERIVSVHIFAGAMRFIARHPLRSTRVLSSLRRSRSLLVALKNLAVAPKACWLAGRIEASAVDHIHAHWAAHSATVGYFTSRLLGVPWSFTAHRWDIAENNLLELKVSHAQFTRAIDTRGACELARNANVSVDRIDVIHMGVALPGRDNRCSVLNDACGGHGEETSDGEPFRFVVVANFAPKKGHRYLFEAVAMLRHSGSSDMLVDVVGDGLLRRELRSLVSELELTEQIRFLGWVPHEEMTGRLRDREWDAMVLPSVITSDGHTEGIPVALMEAMAAGVPAISTNIGGIPELLGGGAGLLVEPRDVAGLANALDAMMSDGELRQRLRKIGLERVRVSFSVGSVVDELERRFVQYSSDGRRR